MVKEPERRAFVSQEKSLLIAEAFVGCSLGCGYCFRDEATETIPRRVMDDENLVDLLLNSRYFIRDRSRLSVNCNFTDPFLPQTKKSTFRILNILEAEGLRNLVSLITKMPLSDEDIGHLKSFQSLDLEVCVSYSEMPNSVEPIDNESRIETLHRLGKSGLRTLHFYRPIAMGWNTSPDQIRKALSVAGDSGIDVVMVGGILLSNSLIRRIQERSGLPPPEYNVKGYKKYLSSNFKEILFQTYGELGLQIPMVRRTSCGRSVIRGLPDYNGHWVEPEKNCWPTCPPKQRDICAGAKAPTPEDIGYLLGRINSDAKFEINPNKTVTFYSEFNRRETNFLRGNLGVMIYKKTS